MSLSWVISAFLAAAVVLGIIGRFLFRSEWTVAFRTIGRFVFLVGIPVLVCIVAPVVVVAQSFNLDPRIWQAFIAGMVILSGWLTTNIFAELGRLRDREERLRDTHRAIFAEVANNLSNLFDERTLDTHAEQIIARMNSNEAFVPFVPKENVTRIFDSMDRDIFVLPRVTIDPIVEYYSQIDAIRAMAEDIRGEAYQGLSKDRRIAVYKDYIEMKKQALVFGRTCNHLIDVYSKSGKVAAEKEAERLKSLYRPIEISNRGAGPSAT